MGWIVMSTKLRKKGKYYERPEFYAPLSYGRDGEPSPELLLSRDRATVFSSRTEAIAAIKATIKQSLDEGATWPKKYAIYTIETDEAPYNVEVRCRPTLGDPSLPPG
jgi:hypothetical protein